MPRRFYEYSSNLRRIRALTAAIDRYIEAGLPINEEWIEEYNDLAYKINSHIQVSLLFR